MRRAAFPYKQSVTRRAVAAIIGKNKYPVINYIENTPCYSYRFPGPAQFSKGRTYKKIDVQLFEFNDIFCILNEILHQK